MDIDFGICAFSDYDEDGHLQIQIDSPGVDDSEGTQPAEALSVDGMRGRPLDPDKGPEGEIGLGAPCLTVASGDHRYVIPLNDPRDVDKLPKLRKGGKMLAGGAGDYRSFVLIDGEDPATGSVKKPGSITVSASYAKAGVKKSLGLSFNVRDEGTEDISIFHGNGQRITLGENGVTITNAAGDAYVEVGPDGNVLAGPSAVQGALTVGAQLAATAVPIWAPLLSYLTALEALLKTNTGAPLVMVPPIASVAKLIEAQHLKTT